MFHSIDPLGRNAREIVANPMQDCCERVGRTERKPVLASVFNAKHARSHRELPKPRLTSILAQ